MQKKQQKSALARKTERLWIRPYEESDFAVWKNSWEPSASARSFNLIRSLQFFLNAGGALCHLGIFERESGRLIGMLVYYSGELTLWLPEAGAKRKYGKELTSAALDIAFETLALKEVLVTTHAKNRVSRFKAKQKGGNRHGPGTRL